MKFIAGLADRVDELVLFGRLDPAPGRSHYVVREDVRFVPLPHYSGVTNIAAQMRALRSTRRAFAATLGELDAVWVFGPHPIAVALAVTARRHGTPLFLGVRQDYPTYIARRIPGWKWSWALGAAHALERGFRTLARRAPTVVLGDELARAYAGGPAPVLSTGFSLVRAEHVPAVAPRPRAWGETWRILSVGRLDAEKNPLLLVDILVRLRARDHRWRLTVAGDGPLRDALARRAADARVADAIDLVGYVPQGPALDALYGRHDVFLHVSLTEGLPQVLVEAQAASLPLVATAVGGVRAALEPTDSALLIPPADAAAAAGALGRLAGDPDLRARLALRGLDHARSETMDAQLDRIVAFFAAGLRSP